MTHPSDKLTSTCFKKISDKFTRFWFEEGWSFLMIMNYLAICTTRQLYQNLRVLVKPPFSWIEFILLVSGVKLQLAENERETIRATFTASCEFIRGMHPGREAAKR